MLLQNLDLAIKELGKEITVKNITDEKTLHTFGIYETPAVIITYQKVKSQGKNPSVELIKEWLKEL